MGAIAFWLWVAMCVDYFRLMPGLVGEMINDMSSATVLSVAFGFAFFFITGNVVPLIWRVIFYRRHPTRSLTIAMLWTSIGAALLSCAGVLPLFAVQPLTTLFDSLFDVLLGWAFIYAGYQLSQLCIVAFLEVRFRTKYKNRVQKNLCLKCGYQLTQREASSCPECGFSFNAGRT